MKQDGAARGRRGWLWVAGGGFAGCVLTALALYMACGGQSWGALLCWGAAALGIFAPGLCAAWLICGGTRRQECPPAPALFLSLAVLWGFALFFGVTLAASALRAPVLVRLWCAAWGAGGIVCLARPAARRNIRQFVSCCLRFAQSGAGAALAVTTGALILLNALWAVRYAHPTAVSALIPSQDFFWNLGNVESFANGLPLSDLRVAGVTVTYHFLTELYEAGLWFAPGLPAYDTAAFYAYTPIALALTTCLYALGRQLWPHDACRRRAAALAGMPLWLSCVSLWKTLAAGASRFGNSGAVHTVSNINGQATAFLFLALTLLFLDRIFARVCNPAGQSVPQSEDTARPGEAWEWLSLTAAFYGLAFAKGPQAGILAIAVFCVLALVCLQNLRTKGRPMLRRVALLCWLVPLGFELLYSVYFAAGAGSSMRFSLDGTVKLFYFQSVLNALQIRFPGAWKVFLPLLWLAQSFFMAPAAFCAWACAAIGDIRKKLRVPPVRLVLHACAAGGLLAFFLFDHYSSSQIYFANLAVFCMGLFLLDSLPALLAGKGRLRRILRAGAAALTAAGCATSLCLFVSMGRTAADTFTGTLPDTVRCVLTADEERACAWLAENMPENALFATNRMHTGGAMEGLSNVYTGLSGRQAYMESFKYAVSNMGARAGDVQARYAEMETLFSAGTSAAQAREICAARGIEYLVFCPLLPGDEAHLAQAFPCVYESEGCRVYWVGA